jgi:hypothetical protein
MSPSGAEPHPWPGLFPIVNIPANPANPGLGLKSKPPPHKAMTAQTANLSSVANPADAWTVYTRQGAISFPSVMSAETVREALLAIPGGFAASLASASRWSERQEGWARYLVFQAEQAALAEPDDTYQGLFTAIQSAQSAGLKRIKLRFIAGLSVSPARAYSDRLYVKQDGNYVGKLTPTGSDIKDPEILAILQDAAEDPAKAAALYGREVGECSCCGRELTDPRSISLGIGPICARKFGWLK